jgi:hypothetical protein
MAKRQSKPVRINELMPLDYTTLSDEDKKKAVEDITIIFIKQFATAFGEDNTTIEILNKILQDTIITYEETEDYEVCSLLKSMIEYINE